MGGSRQDDTVRPQLAMSPMDARFFFFFCHSMSQVIELKPCWMGLAEVHGSVEFILSERGGT